MYNYLNSGYLRNCDMYLTFYSESNKEYQLNSIVENEYCKVHLVEVITALNGETREVPVNIRMRESVRNMAGDMATHWCEKEN